MAALDCLRPKPLHFAPMRPLLQYAGIVLKPHLPNLHAHGLLVAGIDMRDRDCVRIAEEGKRCPDLGENDPLLVLIYAAGVP